MHAIARGAIFSLPMHEAHTCSTFGIGFIVYCQYNHKPSSPFSFPMHGMILPQLARPLLQKPTQVLKPKNLFLEDFSSLSEAEVEGTLEDDYPPDNERCEHGEMLLYKISLLEECGFLEGAIEELHKKEPKIVDKLTYKEQEVSLLLKLGSLEEVPMFTRLYSP